MILSTPRFNYLKGITAALAIPLAAFVLCHCGLEALSRWAESKPGYYLWRNDDHLLLLSPAKFSRPGKRRVMIFGASETAEGFVDTVMERRMPGLSVENMAFDGATFNDLLFQLEYLDRIYGPASVPSDIVIGLSHRLISNITIPRTRLFKDAVNKYSPGQATGNGASARVKRKNRLQAAVSWLRFRLHQTERYRYAIQAAWIRIASTVRPGWVQKSGLRTSLMKEKTWSRTRSTDDEIRVRLGGIDHWQKTHAWKISEHRGIVEPELRKVIAFAQQHHIRLYFVNMPLLPVNKGMFAPGLYEDYLQVVNEVRGDVPLLDLGELLPDVEFSDAVHATEKGAIHISTATADFLRQHELSTQAVQ